MAAARNPLIVTLINRPRKSQQPAAPAATTGAGAPRRSYRVQQAMIMFQIQISCLVRMDRLDWERPLCGVLPVAVAK